MLNMADAQLDINNMERAQHQQIARRPTVPLSEPSRLAQVVEIIRQAAARKRAQQAAQIGGGE